MRYSRVCYQIGESPEIGELLETNPLAAALFPLAIARADLFGILPRDARRFRSRVCPSANLDLEAVEKALSDMERLDLIRSYQDDEGKPLLQITNYHRHQVVRWGHGVGAPDEQLPHWWSTPVELQEWLDSGKCRKPEEWRRKGFRVVDRIVNSGSTPVVQPEHSNRSQHTDTDTDTRTTRPSAPPAVADAALPKRRKETEDQKAIRETFERLTGSDWPGGSPKGYSGLMAEVRGRSRAKLLAWAESGHETTRMPEDVDPVAWFFRAAPEALRQSFKWEGKGGNGPEPALSFRGWPSRFETERLRDRFTDEEVLTAARSPDYYLFPKHNINGTEQQRLEAARREYEREQDRNGNAPGT